MLKHTPLGLCAMLALTACQTQSGSGFTATATAPAQASAANTSVESEGRILASLNAQRAKSSLPPLVYNGQLTRAARAHANDQARKGYFSHTGQDGSQISDRVQRTGYKYCLIAENLSMGYPSAQGAVQGWMASEGHRRNIMNRNFTDVGIGIGDGALYVAVFGDPC
jgi:uncharacterized protein YkwD